MTTNNLQLVYTILCDDVRLEAGNKLSLMGVFQNIFVEKLPVALIKFAVLNHWRGSGGYLSEVRILSPDKSHAVVMSQPTRFEIAPGGYADNVSFFVNTSFHQPGTYWVQTLINSNLYHEMPLMIADTDSMQPEAAAESVN
jgi:hypothetical protein